MATKKENEAATVETTAEATATESPAFTREQLRSSKKFSKYKDIVSVVIGADESCTTEECEKRIDEFLKGKCERSVK